jgi:hypothetical protein
MNDAKYIGLDVHQATISVAALDSTGKLVMEAILETILQFIGGLRCSLHVTLEEETCAAWLNDLLKPHATQVLVCDPRKNDRADGLRRRLGNPASADTRLLHFKVDRQAVHAKLSLITSFRV